MNRQLRLPDRSQCAAALDRLILSSGQIHAAMLALADGRPYAMRHAASLDSNKFAAMTSSLFALGLSVLRELDAGTLDHALIEGSKGKLVVSTIPGSAGLLTLAVLAHSDAPLGRVLGHGKACALAVAAIPLRACEHGP